MRTVEALDIAINELMVLDDRELGQGKPEIFTDVIGTLLTLRELIADGAFDEYQPLFEGN